MLIIPEHYLRQDTPRQWKAYPSSLVRDMDENTYDEVISALLDGHRLHVTSPFAGHQYVYLVSDDNNMWHLVPNVLIQRLLDDDMIKKRSLPQGRSALVLTDRGKYRGSNSDIQMV